MYNVLKNMAMAAVVALCLSSNVTEAKLEVPKDFAEFKNWLDNATLEEKHEHFNDISESYIERHGEMANKIRLCINIDQNWLGMDNWVD